MTVTISLSVGSWRSAKRQSMETEISSSLRRHLYVAFGVIILLFGGLGAAAAAIKIKGAVIATGRIVVETNIKRVQHQEGGIVREIHVREGQTVSAGDLLVRIDDTLPRTNLTIIQKRLYELWSQEARLTAERDGRTEFDPASLAVASLVREFDAIQEGQRTLLSARLTSRNVHKAQLAEQIKQYEEQITGLVVQRDAKAEEIRLIRRELGDLKSLLDKGLIEKSRLTALMREKARLEGERGRFISEIAQSAQAISERKVQVLQIDEDMRAEVVEQLQAVRAEIAELEEQRVAAKEQLSRSEVRAPRAGIVHQLAVHTVGGVVASGEDLMAIVPQEDMLVIEAQVAPTDIDQMSISQEAIIRLPGLDQRSTPELKAKVLNVSADLMQDPATGLSYYRARLALPDEEIARLDGKPLVPGMPVEAFVQSEARSILSYLVKPLSDHLAHAFRES